MKQFVKAFRITEEQYLKVKKIGSGNASKGIRAIITEFFLENKGKRKQEQIRRKYE
jgi:hypothetical protein